MKCKPDYFPSRDKLQGQRIFRVEATLRIASVLPGALKKVLHELGDEIVESEVVIDYSQLHPLAENVDDMQIMVYAPTGFPYFRMPDEYYRCCHRRQKIKSSVQKEIATLIDQGRAAAVKWPKFDIEVQLTELSGYTVAPDGTILNSWGGDLQEDK